MHKENSRCNYCGRILYKNVSNKYIVCSEKCKSLIKKTDKLKSVDSIVFGLIDYKWNKVEDLFQKVQIDKFEFISSIRRLIYFKKKLKTKESKEINQKSLISKVKK